MICAPPHRRSLLTDRKHPDCNRLLYQAHDLLGRRFKKTSGELMELDEVHFVDEVLPELLLPPGDGCKVPNFRNSVYCLGNPKESKHSQTQTRVSENGKVTCTVLPALKNWLTELVPRKRMQGRRLIAGRLVDVELTSLPSR